MINTATKFFAVTLIILGAIVMAPKLSIAQNVVESFTIEGGPIATKHFQSSDEDFREHHGLAIAKIHTNGYGNWGVYYLGPNSVHDTSIGFGYVTDPYVIPISSLSLELSAALGLVSGYQDYPVPLLAGQARLVLFDHEDWDAGISAALLPYYVDDQRYGDGFGIVATTPFLSVRRNF